MIQGLSAIEKAGSASSVFESLPGAGVSGANVAAETSFSEALSSVSAQAIGTLEKAEGISMKALQGDVETREVVDAVMSAEQTLQAAIAIRDKIVTAYLEVSRMAI